MDDEWVNSALAAIEANADQIQQQVGSGIGDAVAGTSLAGDPPLSLGNLLALRDNAPFVRMLANPAVVARLQWMLGPGFRFNPSGAGSAFCAEPGASGQALHAAAAGLPTYTGWAPVHVRAGTVSPLHLSMVADARCYQQEYSFKGGSTFCHQVNCAFQLTDVAAGDGGFIVCAASHGS